MFSCKTLKIFCLIKFVCVWGIDINLEATFNMNFLFFNWFWKLNCTSWRPDPRWPMCMCVLGQPPDNLVYGLLGWSQDDICVWTIGPTSKQHCVWNIGPTSRQPKYVDVLCLDGSRSNCKDVLCPTWSQPMYSDALNPNLSRMPNLLKLPSLFRITVKQSCNHILTKVGITPHVNYLPQSKVDWSKNELETSIKLSSWSPPRERRYDRKRQV